MNAEEPDEKFSNGLMFPGDPNGGAAEVVNCRCTSDTRARWALDEDELEELKKRAAFFGLDKTENFKEFEEKYLHASEQYRRKTAEDGHQIIDEPTYNKLTKRFIRNGGIIIRGEAAERHLQNIAYASYIPGAKVAFIRDDATFSDMLEEMYHAEQDRKKMFGDVLTDEVLLRREIDAQKYLISLKDRYKMPLKEIEVTEKNLAEYEQRLKKLLKGSE